MQAQRPHANTTTTLVGAARLRSFRAIWGTEGEMHLVFRAHASQTIKRYVFFKIFYRKIALKNHISPFLKFKIVNTQLIIR